MGYSCNFSKSIFLIIFRYNTLDYLRALPFTYFTYPLDVDLPAVVGMLQSGSDPHAEPINLVKYPIILDSDRMCKSDDGDMESIFMLFVIKSKRENFELRDAIRRTWARENLISFTYIKKVFILGVKQGDDKVQSRIGTEQLSNYDIVQGYFQDTYANNTIKTMMGFEWVSTNCRGAQYVAFVDDDYFIATFNIVQMLRGLNPMQQQQKEDFIIGSLREKSLVVRQEDHGMYTKYEDYSYRYWPPYVLSGAYVLSQKTAQKVYLAMHYVKRINYDGIFIGMVAKKLGIPLIHNKHILLRDKPSLSRVYKSIIAVHRMQDAEELLEWWQYYLSLRENSW